MPRPKTLTEGPSKGGRNMAPSCPKPPAPPAQSPVMLSKETIVDLIKGRVEGIEQAIEELKEALKVAECLDKEVWGQVGKILGLVTYMHIGIHTDLLLERIEKDPPDEDADPYLVILKRKHEYVAAISRLQRALQAQMAFWDMATPLIERGASFHKRNPKGDAERALREVESILEETV